MISKELIEQKLHELSIGKPIHVHVFEQLDSTNQWLQENISARGVERLVCVAEKQSSGRGRAGRSWLSPGGGNIYMSFSYLLKPGLLDFSAISLVIGIAVIKALQAIGVSGLALKWPNDILLEGAKLAGVLIQTRNVGDKRFLIIGIGINVQMPDASTIKPDINWRDLSGFGVGSKDRELIIAHVLKECELVIEAFFNEGFSIFRDQWESYDAWAGKAVMVTDQDKMIVSGTEAGIDLDGRLQVKTEHGLVKVQSGDVSLRIQQ